MQHIRAICSYQGLWHIPYASQPDMYSVWTSTAREKRFMAAIVCFESHRKCKFARPLDRDRQTDRRNFGHTNCGCIDGAAVYGPRGPALSPRPPNPTHTRTPRTPYHPYTARTFILTHWAMAPATLYIFKGQGSASHPAWASQAGPRSEIPNLSHFWLRNRCFWHAAPRSMKISSRPIGRILHQGRAAGKKDDWRPQMAIF